MLHIGKFLSKTKGVIDESETTRKNISEVLFTVLNLQIPQEKISLVGSTIKLKVSPLQKLHIILNKQKILSKIKTHPTLSSRVKDIL